MVDFSGIGRGEVGGDDSGEYLISFGYDLKECIRILLFMVRITKLSDAQHPDL